MRLLRLALLGAVVLPIPAAARCWLIGQHDPSWTHAVAIGWMRGPACQRCGARLPKTAA